MSAEPEILHTSDVPSGAEGEPSHEDEAQSAIMARIDAMRNPSAGRTDKRVNARKGKGAGKLAPMQFSPVIAAKLRDKGNPGLKRTWRDLRVYANNHSYEAIDFLVQVMRDPLCKTQDRLIAAQTLLDRGQGKAVEISKMEVTTNEGAEATKNVLMLNGQKVTF
jgi:hypothetical protein